MVHKDNAVEVESVDALDSRDHVVHPGEGLLVRAGRPLFCHYHHPLVSQDIDGEYSDSGDLGRRGIWGGGGFDEEGDLGRRGEGKPSHQYSNGSVRAFVSSNKSWTYICM